MYLIMGFTNNENQVVLLPEYTQACSSYRAAMSAVNSIKDDFFEDRAIFTTDDPIAFEDGYNTESLSRLNKTSMVYDSYNCGEEIFKTLKEARGSIPYVAQYARPEDGCERSYFNGVRIWIVVQKI